MFENFVIEKNYGMGELKIIHADVERDLSIKEIPFGRITFGKNDSAGAGEHSIIVGGSDFLFFGTKRDANSNTYPEEGCLSIKNYGNFGIGTKYPSKNVKLDINGIMKLKIEPRPPLENEAGMIAIANGSSAGWDPKGTNLGKPYPVFFDGSEWIAFF